MKVSQSQLLEIVRKLVKEALQEAGPMGYLSKTQRPDGKTMWDPNAQKQWVDAKSAPGTPGMPAPTTKVMTTSPGSPPTTLGGNTPAEQPPMEMGDKTNPGRPMAKAGTTPSLTGTAPGIGAPAAVPKTASAQPATVPPQKSLADLSKMMQGATQDQIAQIMSILNKS